MNEKLCNVALAVPLRTTFTYKVPERLAAEIQPGSRVVVPFRKKSLVGVVTEWAAQGPPDTKLREVQKCLDVIPALTKNLLYLAQWISSYYVAPIGEVYRDMLPPLMELAAQQLVRITELGRSASSSLLGEIEAKPALLQKLESANDGVPLQTALRSGVALGDLLKLQRRGLVEILQQIQTRKRRAQRIIAWRSTGTNAPVSSEKEARLGDICGRGKTGIVLVHEIGLTLWMGGECRGWFGARFEGVAVLHSALSDIERAREWWRVRNGEARVIVGTRSAIFAPAEKLGLVIVDEEQESSYKQEETPRYHGRDVAIVRAKLENALALLGSATPSLETYHHACSGKYELLTLAQRVAERSLPSVEILDLREEFKQTHQTNPISLRLRQAIQESLNFQAQALVLINRRGYSWRAVCRSCGATVQCANCSISMTHHTNRNRLECHYCGSLQPIPQNCHRCDSKYVYFFGEGSEQLEERLRKEFPKAHIARLDPDTRRTKRQKRET